MKLAIVGITGLVGEVVLRVLDEFQIEYDQLIPVASERSVGKLIENRGQTIPIVSTQSAIAQQPDVAIFSAGGSVSQQFAPQFASIGCRVIDNSSVWRMSPDHKLIVPEVNGDSLSDSDYIIANPNCSTIQLVMVLAPLHRKFGLKRVVVSTYQSVTGTGKAAVNQLENEQAGSSDHLVYPHQINRNAIPHIDEFQEGGYTKEELKIVNETRKILGEPGLAITATAVRLPIVGGHSEAVNLEFENSYHLDEIKAELAEFEGVVIMDDPHSNQYPMPIHAHEKNDVFVGRIRRDDTIHNGLNLWIVADNLRKGAATNTVQILDHLLKRSIVS